MSDLVSQLIEITGLDREAAGNILRINDNNLEQAINYHLENGFEDVIPIDDDDDVIASIGPGISENASLPTHAATTRQLLPQSEDGVRAPIPSKREQLLLPEEDQFSFNYAQTAASRKRRAAITVCPFRDFAREAELQEAELMGNGSLSTGSGILPLQSAFANHPIAPPPPLGIFGRTSLAADDLPQSASTIAKRKRLEDLFRPPIDLLFWGTFQAARDHATKQNHWLIVNLQDQCEFKSQILNRDIWSDKKLRELIKSHFIFWQISIENPEGMRFRTFYHVNDIPYVCVIDPRTGEEKLKCDISSPQAIYSELMQFLNENSFKLDISSEKKVKSIPTSTATSSASPSKNGTKNLISKTLELSEEDQIALAIRNSLKENQDHNTSDSTDNLESNIDFEWSDPDDDDSELLLNSAGSSNKIANDEKSSKKNSKAEFLFQPKFNYRDFLGDNSEPMTKIQLRLPDGQRDQFDWPSTTKLLAIKLYILENYSDIVKDQFKLISSYPRQNILELNEYTTLLDAKLHPTVILYIHPDE